MNLKDQINLNFKRSPIIPDDFIVTQVNENAFNLINAWPAWEGTGKFSKFLYLYGPQKSGKSHLAYIWQKETNAQILNDKNIAKLLEERILKNSCFIVENIEKIKSENELFHLFNILNESQSYLLITSRSQPSQLDIGLADLRSRINSINIVAIELPDDILIRQLIVKYFLEHQIHIETDIIAYIIKRIDRSYQELFSFVTKLNQLSLTQQRKITIPFIRENIF